MNKLFLVTQLIKKREISKDKGISIIGTISLEDETIGLAGMLPIFKTEKQARELFPKSEIIEIVVEDVYNV